MAKAIADSRPDPEDMFADTRMSFGDHIDELRSHLLRAVYGFVICMVVAILPPIGPFAIHFITKPVEDQLQAFYDRYYDVKLKTLVDDEARNVRPIHTTIRFDKSDFEFAVKGGSKKVEESVLRHMIPAVEAIGRTFGADANAKEPEEDRYVEIGAQIPDPSEITRRVIEINRLTRPEGLAVMSVTEGLFVYLAVGLLTGFVMASPWVFYQLWSFVAAGLFPHEKKLVNVYLPYSIGLFLGGFFVCEYMALPRAIESLLWFNEWLGFKPDLRLSEWLWFALLMPLIFGISFQTPLVMLFLFKIGIFDVAQFKAFRRISYFLMAALVVVFSPSADIPSLAMLWIPMCLLYEVGIILCRMQPPRLEPEYDDSDLDAMIGV
jgi:sec-independent protein translocase protein TatC